jgi:hypothetical protein
LQRPNFCRVRLPVPKVNDNALHWLRSPRSCELEAHQLLRLIFTTPRRDSGTTLKACSTLI